LPFSSADGWCRYKRRKKWMLIEKEKLKRAQEKQA
jgi:hypothetical protein